MNLDDIFKDSFLNNYNERNKKKLNTTSEDRLISENKKRQLGTIIKFLNKLVNMEVYVNNSEIYLLNNRSISELKPQKFSYRLDSSSKRWAPGISIFIDHPATMEIAIPNKPEEDGVVKIHLASAHPQSHIFHGTFLTHLQACEALGFFLSQSATSIGKPYNDIEEVENDEFKISKSEDSKNAQSYFSVKRGDDSE